MDIYNTPHEAIIKLHERGYAHDFQLHGKGLLWLQGKSFIPPDEFMILECYRMYNPGDHVFVLGINCTGLNLKGILIIHSADNKLIPPGIAKKLNAIKAYA